MTRACIALAAAALVLLGSSGCDAEPEPTTTADPPAGEQDVYFTAGEQLERVPATASTPEAAAEALLEGPGSASDAAGEASTEIPSGSELKRLEVGDEGTATMVVSGRFAAGVPTEPAQRSPRQREKLDARLAQAVFTLTGFEEVDRARVVSGGVSLGGARDRSDFARPEPKAPRSKLDEPEPSGRASSGTKALQRRLAELRYLPKGAIDGIEGYRTRQAVTAFQAWEGLARDGIAGPQTMAALENAKRPRPKGDGPSRRLEVNRDLGVTLIVKRGRTKRALHTSSGAPGYTTPAGRFEVFRKEVNSWSVPYQTWLPWASYFNAGIAFHAYPDVPPYRASHGCIRVPEPEAEHLYDFARLGTVVIVR